MSNGLVNRWSLVIGTWSFLGHWSLAGHWSFGHHHPLQNLHAALEFLIGRRVADAEMRIPPAERDSGDQEQVVPDRLLGELRAGAPRRLRGYVERPTRSGDF